MNSFYWCSIFEVINPAVMIIFIIILRRLLVRIPNILWSFCCTCDLLATSQSQSQLGIGSVLPQPSTCPPVSPGCSVWIQQHRMGGFFLLLFNGDWQPACARLLTPGGWEVLTSMQRLKPHLQAAKNNKNPNEQFFNKNDYASSLQTRGKVADPWYCGYELFWDQRMTPEQFGCQLHSLIVSQSQVGDTFNEDRHACIVINSLLSDTVTDKNL